VGSRFREVWIRQRGHTEVYRGAEYTIDFALAKLEILVDDEEASDVAPRIIDAARTGRSATAKVDRAGRERSASARGGWFRRPLSRRRRDGARHGAACRPMQVAPSGAWPTRRRAARCADGLGAGEGSLRRSVRTVDRSCVLVRHRRAARLAAAAAGARARPRVTSRSRSGTHSGCRVRHRPRQPVGEGVGCARRRRPRCAHRCRGAALPRPDPSRPRGQGARSLPHVAASGSSVRSPTRPRCDGSGPGPWPMLEPISRKVPAVCAMCNVRWGWALGAGRTAALLERATSA
jgi:hypothetical protein